MNLKEKIYSYCPHIIQNWLISIYNFRYRIKIYNKEYESWKKWYRNLEFESRIQLEEIQLERLKSFLTYVKMHSPYYRSVLSKIDIDAITSVADLKQIPLLDKETLRKEILNISTSRNINMYIAKTGGTTGKSLEVKFEWSDFRERMALLDVFRERFGYKRGSRVGWLSGKSFLSEKDLIQKRFWKSDYLNNIKYYSTFHINGSSCEYYINDINSFQPEYFVAFPSSLLDLARYGKLKGLSLNYKPQGIFPTSESLSIGDIFQLEDFFGCKVHDQYASSEGAPFIMVCQYGQLHYEVLSGVIEVVDEWGNESNVGEIIITSFSTRGTPLIRYKIEDRIKLMDGLCKCGRHTPMVEYIDGRISDYICSKETGNIYLGNLSNCIKYVNGVLMFQVVQDSIDEISVNIVVDRDVYTKNDEIMFTRELRIRLGNKIGVKFVYLKEIKKEKSGKFRMIKNSIKSSILNN